LNISVRSSIIGFRSCCTIFIPVAIPFSPFSNPLPIASKPLDILSECRFLDQYQIIDYRNVFASDVMPQMIIGAEFLYGFQYGIGLRLIVPEAYITKESIINVVEEFVKNDFKPFERIDRPFTTEERQQLKSRVVAF